MAEEARLRAELEETKSQPELAKQHLRLCTAVIRDLRSQQGPIPHKIVRKQGRNPDIVSRHLTTTNFVSANKDEILRDVYTRLYRSESQSHLWTTKEEVSEYISLIEEANSIVDIIKYLPPDPSEHL